MVQKYRDKSFKVFYLFLIYAGTLLPSVPFSTLKRFDNQLLYKNGNHIYVCIRNELNKHFSFRRMQLPRKELLILWLVLN